MKFKSPPHGGKFKLVATKKHKNDIGLIVLCPDRREYSWRNVMLDYEDYEWHGGAMSVIKEDYNKEWEREFQEELFKQPLDDIE